MCPADKSYIADRLTGTCYRVELSRKNWTAARDACAANGERLVVLEPVVKAQFFADFFKANKGRWAGKTVLYHAKQTNRLWNTVALNKIDSFVVIVSSTNKYRKHKSSMLT